MSQPKKYPVAMTLRLQEQVADEIEDIAFTLNLSKASFIRRSIRRAIEFARQHELPLIDKLVKKALKP
jgi:predicted transcriptional regulator